MIATPTSLLYRTNALPSSATATREQRRLKTCVTAAFARSSSAIATMPTKMRPARTDFASSPSLKLQPGVTLYSCSCPTSTSPCFISVERDVTGEALPLALSIARGIGATRGGAIQSSAREEAALDLFSEQAVWPTIIVAFQKAYEVLHQAGFSDEAILY